MLSMWAVSCPLMLLLNHFLPLTPLRAALEPQEGPGWRWLRGPPGDRPSGEALISACLSLRGLARSLARSRCSANHR